MAQNAPVIFEPRALPPDDALRTKVEQRLRESIGCSFAVTLRAPGTVPRSEGGKLQRVLDRRLPA